MKAIWELCVSFFRIGLMMFGGGYAMLPLLRREVVDRRKWINDEELLECFALSQCTPGAIAVNAATYIGFRRKGVPGGIAATLAVVLPATLVLTVIALCLRHFASNPYVRWAFAGIRVAVAVLICETLLRLYQKGVRGAFANGVFAASFLVMLLTQLSPIWVILAAVVLGVAAELLRGRRSK